MGHGFVFDLQFNHDQWQFRAGMIGLLATVMVLPMIDLSQPWVVVVWLTLFIVQIVQRIAAGLRGPSVAGVYYGREYRVRFKDGSVEACALVCTAMHPIGFLLRLRTDSAKQYTVPVLKAYTEPCAYRRASVWLRFYPK